MAGRSAHHFYIWLSGIVLAVLATTGEARAQEAEEPPVPQPDDAGQAPPARRDDIPWIQGQSLAERARARQIFLEANVLLEDTLFARAAARYEDALAIWPHPAFSYNLALARIHLNQPIEAYEAMRQAVRYGPAPLGEDLYRNAQNFLALLASQLAEIEVACAEPDATITLDGKLLFVGPGRHTFKAVPGGHVLMAARNGRIPATEQLVLAPGQRATVALVLHRPERTVTVRYMPAWIPWASLGVGAAVLGVGGYVGRQASDALAAFDVDFNRRCPRGCTEIEAPGYEARLARIGRKQAVARGLYIGGGAVVVVSAALLYVNRERVERRTDDGAISVMPMVDPNVLGLTARVRF